MAQPVSNGLFEVNGAKLDENSFGCMKLIEFLNKDGVTHWDEWHYRYNQASRGECHYSDRCPIYAKTANKFLSKTKNK